MTETVLVTGSSGFVGQRLVTKLAVAGYRVRAASRDAGASGGADGVEVVRLPNLAERIGWEPLLEGIAYVVHLAGVAHRGAAVSEEMYDRINHLATADLARAAVKAGVSRMIFMSSIGSQSGPSAEHELSEADEPRPTTAYGRSKLAAELALRASGVRHTILRPVLVYGPHAPGNMGTLVRLAASPWPLPFGALAGRRSLLAVDNLTSAIHFAMQSRAAENETYLAADLDALTLAEIISVMRAALGRSPGLFRLPQPWLAGVLRLMGQDDSWQRLGGSLIASPAKLMAAGWRPDLDTRQGLAAMMRPSEPRRRPDLQLL